MYPAGEGTRLAANTHKANYLHPGDGTPPLQVERQLRVSAKKARAWEASGRA
jgi:hypothetical protein